LRNHYDIYNLMMLELFGRCNGVLAYPHQIASYVVPVRQYRALQSCFLQCGNYSPPPCSLLKLQSVTSAFKGLSPSGKIHKLFVAFRNLNFVFLNFLLSYAKVCAHAYAGHTQHLSKMRSSCKSQMFFFSGINFFLKHLQLPSVLLIYICASRQFCASKSAPRLAVKRYGQG